MRDGSEQEMKYNQNLSAIEGKFSGFQDRVLLRSVQSIRDILSGFDCVVQWSPEISGTHTYPL